MPKTKKLAPETKELRIRTKGEVPTFVTCGQTFGVNPQSFPVSAFTEKQHSLLLNCSALIVEEVAEAKKAAVKSETPKVEPAKPAEAKPVLSSSADSSEKVKPRR
jgi:hypothetical protein